MKKSKDNKKELLTIISKFFELECGYGVSTSKDKACALLLAINTNGNTLTPTLVDDNGRPCKCKSFTIKDFIYGDGTMRQVRTNEGYVATELLGLISYLKHDIITQIEGYKTPDTVRRICIE